MSGPPREVALSQICGVKFGFFSDSEIKKLSVVHCVNPIAYDIQRAPVVGGLYDGRMGPAHRFDICETCKLSGPACPGHFGHIELPLPVYNPFVFQFMYRLLQCTCLWCKRFKMGNEKKDMYEKKFKLIREGKIQEALQIFPTDSDFEKDSKMGRLSGQDSRQPQKHKGPDFVLDKAFQDPTAIGHEAYRDTLSEFLTFMAKASKCKVCKANVPKLRKETSAKVFVRPLSQQQLHHNASNGTVIKSPLNEVVLGGSDTLDFLTVVEVLEIMKGLWSKERSILEHICGGMHHSREDGHNAFFVSILPVTPNCFRPPTLSRGVLTEHSSNTLLSRIINLCIEIRSIDQKSEEELGQYSVAEMTLHLWQGLQASVSEFIDSSTVKNPSSIGIRQFIEKKEGLFRRNMMGKRVNYACRSTISPDPYLGVGEIGVPPYFARNLSFPEIVTPWNADKLKKMIENGADKHPGALAVEDNKGRVLSLAKMPKGQRIILASTLFQGHDGIGGKSRTKFGAMRYHGTPIGTIKVVCRHLRDGDVMLTNRQPTLHKASLMAHRVKILDGERTVRFHYANCATFNADFDGDEINLHLPQDNLCRAEGYGIVHADQQYILPTNGKPVRGLIQDSVDAGVLLTMRDTFLTKSDYTQLVFSAIGNRFPVEQLCGPESFEAGSATRLSGKQEQRIYLEEPTYLKPGPYWTGKQVVSTVLRNITRNLPLVTMSSKCKTPNDYWGDPIEGSVCFRHGTFLHGVFDKAQYGDGGVVHACQELYGNTMAGEVLSCLGRLFVQFLQMHGFTCGIGDCFLDSKVEESRAKLVNLAEWKALESSAKVIGRTLENTIEKPQQEQEKAIADVTRDLSVLYRENSATGAVHDSAVKGPMHQLSSQVVEACLPAGISRPFRHNCLTIMTTTGAKGSFVNFSQIACLLGQQELEGRRVPRMVSGKTLPCFPAFDPRARASGFIKDRFLTGLQPPEYFFHCMAGREGLVDTSVKTANSGYLQRCLVKCMEGLSVQYDGTVRDDADGSIFQFLYGEDGLDVINTAYLNDFKFIAENGPAFRQQLVLDEALASSRMSGLTESEKQCRKMARKRKRYRLNGKTAELEASLPINASMRPTIMGATSEKFLDDMHDYIAKNPDGLLKEGSFKHINPNEFQSILQLKYMEALAAPGEAVGVIAAQSIGEPSTQMTLNTFHMAGRGEANVTLGIPRLREILMSAAKNIRTPIMVLPLRDNRPLSDAKAVANMLRRISLSECLKGLKVEECPAAPNPLSAAGHSHVYEVTLTFYPISSYPPEAGLTWERLKKVFESVFVPKLRAAVRAELRRLSVSSKAMSVDTAPMGDDAGFEGNQGVQRRKKSAKYEDDEDDEENVEGKAQYGGGRSEEKYDAPDDEDARLVISAAKELEEKFDDVEEDELDEHGADTGEALAPMGTTLGKDGNLVVDEGSGDINSFAELLGIEESSDVEQCTVTAAVDLPLNSPKLLMLGIAESVAAAVAVQEHEGITKCYVVEGEKGNPHTIQTDGVNFSAVYLYDDIIDVNRISTNDIHVMRSFYGVEAARSAIVAEVRGVFGAYGIGVNPRHLTLISDHMTNLGGYRPLNRVGISSQVSPLLKMSFETATGFLRQATLTGDVDSLQSPAARVAVGRPPLQGTGCIDILHNFT